MKGLSGESPREASEHAMGGREMGAGGERGGRKVNDEQRVLARKRFAGPTLRAMTSQMLLSWIFF